VGGRHSRKRSVRTRFKDGDGDGLFGRGVGGEVWALLCFCLRYTKTAVAHRIHEVALGATHVPFGSEAATRA
jgi:hypothetical protein